MSDFNIDLLAPAGAGWSGIGWDGINYFKNIETFPAVVGWTSRESVQGKVFLKVYPIAESCGWVELKVNDKSSGRVPLTPDTFPEVSVDLTFLSGDNTASITSDCPANGLRVYKFQAHVLAPASTPVGQQIAAGMVASLLVWLLWRLLVSRPQTRATGSS